MVKITVIKHLILKQTEETVVYYAGNIYEVNRGHVLASVCISVPSHAGNAMLQPEGKSSRCAARMSGPSHAGNAMLQPEGKSSHCAARMSGPSPGTSITHIDELRQNIRESAAEGKINSSWAIVWISACLVPASFCIFFWLFLAVCIALLLNY